MTNERQALVCYQKRLSIGFQEKYLLFDQEPKIMVRDTPSHEARQSIYFEVEKSSASKLITASQSFFSLPE